MSDDLRLAATLCLFRDGVDGLEVLLMRRHGRAGFMADAWVFPGGVVEAQDHDASWARHLLGADGLSDERRACVVAALRECVEEAGLWLARHDGQPVSLASETQRARFDVLRRQVDGGERTLLEVADADDLTFDAAELRRFAWWVTPTVESRRYDTHFYAALAPAEQRADHDGRELTDAAWLTPSTAIARWESGEIMLAPPTWMVLRELVDMPDAVAAMAWARAAVPRRIEPVITMRDEGPLLLLAGHAEHPVSEVPAGEATCVLLVPPYRVLSSAP